VKKKRLTYQQHQIIGHQLREFRNNVLINTVVDISNTIGKSSKASKLGQKALKAIDDLRSALDDVLFQDFSEKSNQELLNVYYGGNERPDDKPKGGAAK
jgi:hypothetical protein